MRHEAIRGWRPESISKSVTCRLRVDPAQGLQVLKILAFGGRAVQRDLVLVADLRRQYDAPDFFHLARCGHAERMGDG